MQARDCPLRLVMKFLGYAGINENISLLAGTAAHKGLAAWLRGENWMDAIEYYEEVTANNNAIEDRRGYPNLVNVLTEVIHRNPTSALPFYFDRPDAVEIDFCTPLGIVEVGGESVAVDLIGQLDGNPIDRRTDQPWVLEWKTTGRLDTNYTRSFSWSPQITAYWWALEQMTGQEVQGAWVGAIQLTQMPTSDRRCPAHGVTYEECGPEHVKFQFIPASRTREQLDEFQKNALVLSKDVVKAAQFAERLGDKAALKAPCYGPFTRACEFCEFDTWVQTSQRNPDMLSSLLVKRERDESGLRSGFVS